MIALSLLSCVISVNSVSSVISISSRPSQLAELSRSKFDPQLFSHGAYVKFFVTFATKMSYLTFCKKMRQFLIYEMNREGGNKEKIRKCREWISFLFLILSPFPLNFLILSPLPLHFLILSPFSHSQTARLVQLVQPGDNRDRDLDLDWERFSELVT